MWEFDFKPSSLSLSSTSMHSDGIFCVVSCATCAGAGARALFNTSSGSLSLACEKWLKNCCWVNRQMYQIDRTRSDSIERREKRDWMSAEMQEKKRRRWKHTFLWAKQWEWKNYLFSWRHRQMQFSPLFFFSFRTVYSVCCFFIKRNLPRRRWWWCVHYGICAAVSQPKEDSCIYSDISRRRTICKENERETRHAHKTVVVVV